jgi:hypothetical protein
MTPKQVTTISSWHSLSLRNAGDFGERGPPFLPRYRHGDYHGKERDSGYGPMGTTRRRFRKGVYNTFVNENLRYSQNAALNMYDEVNTGTNLPAQIDLYATKGDEYNFLCIAKGGGSANKTYLYQETKALLDSR